MTNGLKLKLEELKNSITTEVELFGRERSLAAENCCPPFAGQPSDMTAELPMMNNKLRDLFDCVNTTIIDQTNVILGGTEEKLEQLLRDACEAARKGDPGKQSLNLVHGIH